MSKTFGGLRHFYTSLRRSSRKKGGFQTVAFSPQLDALVEPIERLVESYKAPEVTAPACRQLLPVPGRSRVYALTTFTATDPGPRRRTGNYWAETIVVPADWLEGGNWDTAAAFAALDWCGPQNAGSIREELPPIELEALVPGPLERLGALVDSVPETVLFPLLLAVIQQSEGLRPLRLVEASGADPRVLEQIVTLLPLVVPPAQRLYRDGRQRRCLTLRTRCPVGGMLPVADLTGFPAAAAGPMAGEEGSVVIDLGSRQVPVSRNSYGESYAHWLHQLLRERNWDDLARRYEQEKVMGPEDPVDFLAAESVAAADPQDAADRAAIEPPADDPPTDDPPPTSPYRARSQAWDARDQAEGEAWTILSQHRRQLESQLGEFRQEMDQAVKEAAAKLAELLDHERETLGSQVDARRALASRSPNDSLERRLAALEADHRNLRKTIAALGGQVPPKSAPLAAGVDPEPPAPSAVAPARPAITRSERTRSSRSGGVWHAERRSRRRLSAAAVPHKAWLAIIGIVGVLALASIFIRPQELFIEGASSEDAILREDRRKVLLRRLQEGEVATRLLRQAESRDAAFRDRAHVLLLTHVLGETPLATEVQAALLQQALALAAVDGQWGSNSSRALLTALPEACKACKAAQPGWDESLTGKSAGCFVGRHLELDDDPCAGESPWSASRVWTEEEAGRALNLVRATASTLAAANQTRLAERVAHLDPGSASSPQWEVFTRLATIPNAELFDLAYALVIGEAAAKAPAELSGPVLDGLETLLGIPAAEDAAGAGEADAAPGEEGA